MKNLQDVAWNNVYGRRDQLQALANRLLPLEKRYRSASEIFFALGKKVEEGGPEVQALSAEHRAAAQEFGLLGETCLMFAEAALNTLADAVVEKWGVDPLRDRSWSFEHLTTFVKKRPGTPLGQALAPFASRMQGLRVRVLLPRSIMSVHPPPVLIGGGLRYRPTGHVQLESSRLWPSEHEELEDGSLLKATVEKDVTLPTEVGSDGWLIMAWALSDAAEKLSDESVTALRRFMRKHGCVTCPLDAIVMTTDLLLDVATVSGYPPSYWAANVQANPSG